MNEKELYRQKLQADLDELKADVAKLRAKAAGIKADAQIEVGRRLKDLDHRVQEAGARLAELAEAGEDAWDSARARAESTWAALKAGVVAAVAAFKEERGAQGPAGKRG